MRIAFYAPMKPPTHAIPSGDRRMARLLIAALEAAGHEVELASVFRSYDGDGDGGRQRRLGILGERLAKRLVRRYRDRPSPRPDAWFTYHLYHKAPDWLGPAVTAAFDIPYLVAEASHAPRQKDGAWALGHRAAARAVAAADLVFGINPDDAACVMPLLGGPGRFFRLKPFLEIGPYGEAASEGPRHRRETGLRHGLDVEMPWLLAVAMMRRGDKLASYRLLGEALERLKDKRWHLLVAGDGPARRQVEAALAGIGERVHWLGEISEEALPGLYAACDILAWPAINEAYGMALLEAQAAGLPVVAGRGPGVAEIVGHGETGLLTPAGEAAAFAGALDRLLERPDEAAAMGAAALGKCAAEHGLDAASRMLERGLGSLGLGSLGR